MLIEQNSHSINGIRYRVKILADRSNPPMGYGMAYSHIGPTGHFSIHAGLSVWSDDKMNRTIRVSFNESEARQLANELAEFFKWCDTERSKYYG